MTNKVWMAFAAALLLIPAAFAQTPVQYQHEKYDLKDGVGYNKYLVSTTPNENSEYTLRLETFVTGKVEATAIPTDFVLVLDNSGSMYFDHRPTSLTLQKYYTVAQNDATHLLKKDPGHGGLTHYAYSLLYQGGNYNASGQSAVSSSAAFFGDEGTVGGGQCSRYYYYEDSANESNTGYYYIFHKKINGYCNLCIKLNDGSYKYLWGSTIHDSPNTDVTNEKYIVYTGDIWRVAQRREALMDAVEAFLNQIKAENDKDQWASGVVKHQVAVASFGSNYQTGEPSATGTAPNGTTPSLTPFTGCTNLSKVVKPFTEVADASVFITAINERMSFRGSTYIDYGVHLAKMLFEDLQSQQGMGPVTADLGTNRNKVAIVVTDGTPNHSGQSAIETISYSLRDGLPIKAKRTSVSGTEINGKIFSIDLYCKSYSPVFLEHLSSNYPEGDHLPSGSTTQNYTGDKEEDGFYKDASDTDLSAIFKSIAEGSTGQQAGQKLVVMDVMSDSFELPQELSGKVKFYTAQCIGEKEIDGKKYLAFAKEIPVDYRPVVPHLWVTRLEGEEGHEEVVWHDLGAEAGGRLDIDNGITYKTTNNGKSITVMGFEFVDLWCGKDEMAEHNYTAETGNTRHEIADDDPNKDYAADGYRGFKLIIEFPIQVSAGALGGSGVPTNDDIHSGFYRSKDDGTTEGNPIITYQKPELTIPVQLAIRKDGLKVNESASFTVQRRTMVEGSEWEDYTTFVLTCTADNDKPMVKLLNLNPDYYYRVKENGWTWAYSDRWQIEANFPTTEDPDLSNPIVITNTPKDDTPKHAEAVKRNELKSY